MTKRPTSQELLALNCQAIQDAKGRVSQPEISRRAKRAGIEIDQKTVSRNLKPDGNATLGTLDALAVAFGVEPWQLLLPQGVRGITSATPPESLALARRIAAIPIDLHPGIDSLLTSLEAIAASRRDSSANESND